jgi:hypothetical protein
MTSRKSVIATAGRAPGVGLRRLPPRPAPRGEAARGQKREVSARGHPRSTPAGVPSAKGKAEGAPRHPDSLATEWATRNYISQRASGARRTNQGLRLPRAINELNKEL